MIADIGNKPNKYPNLHQPDLTECEYIWENFNFETLSVDEIIYLFEHPTSTQAGYIGNVE